jgi:D-glycero-alpha-D-manno-heptose-7-phosphate kinase
MIIIRTPFRISFFGGGTDYPVWYEKNGGSVLSTSIDKYCHITCRFLPPFFKYKYKISYSRIEKAKTWHKIGHPSVKGSLKFMNMENDGISLSYDSDLPARSGLGSSSSFTVGLLNALNCMKGRDIDRLQLAKDAINVEQNIIRENVGSQDQVAAAFGGFNRIDFESKNKIRVSPIIAPKHRIKKLQNHLMIFFTGFSRTASTIAAEQIKITPQKNKELQTMHKMVSRAIDILEGSEDINEFGKLLHESWQIKKHLTSKISNSTIDKIYDTALAAGATGGKLLGAGGGGFILIFSRPEFKDKIKEKLKRLIHVPFSFEKGGSQITYHSPNIR